MFSVVSFRTSSANFSLLCASSSFCFVRVSILPWYITLSLVTYCLAADVPPFRLLLALPLLAPHLHSLRALSSSSSRLLRLAIITVISSITSLFMTKITTDYSRSVLSNCALFSILISSAIILLIIVYLQAVGSK